VENQGCDWQVDNFISSTIISLTRYYLRPSVLMVQDALVYIMGICLLNLKCVDLHFLSCVVAFVLVLMIFYISISNFRHRLMVMCVCVFALESGKMECKFCRAAALALRENPL